MIINPNALAIINPNATVLVMAILVLLYFWMVSRLLVRPLVRVVDQRKSKVEGAQTELEQVNAAYEERLRQYEASILDSRRESISLREKMKKRGESERSLILEQARNESDQKLNQACQEIRDRLDTARSELEAQANDLASRIQKLVLLRES